MAAEDRHPTRHSFIAVFSTLFCFPSRDDTTRRQYDSLRVTERQTDRGRKNNKQPGRSSLLHFSRSVVKSLSPPPCVAIAIICCLLLVRPLPIDPPLAKFSRPVHLKIGKRDGWLLPLPNYAQSAQWKPSPAAGGRGRGRDEHG